MRTSSKRLLALAALLGAVALSAAQAQQKKLPNITILATGGTMAGAAATGTQSGYQSGAVTIDAMLAAVPGIKDLATVKGEQISNVGSQDMSFDIMLKLAQRINELAKGDVAGFVITHGTDTMEETAFFLNLTVKTEKPVVLVGSMRPATAISADGPANLFNAVSLAANPQAAGRGALIVINDEIHYAREAQKMNSTQLDTFESPNRGRAGVMNTGRVYFFFPNNARHTTKAEFSIADVESDELPRVEIVADRHGVVPLRRPVERQVLQHEDGRSSRDLAQQCFEARLEHVGDERVAPRRGQQLGLKRALARGQVDLRGEGCRRRVASRMIQQCGERGGSALVVLLRVERRRGDLRRRR